MKILWLSIICLTAIAATTEAAAADLKSEIEKLERAGDIGSHYYIQSAKLASLTNSHQDVLNNYLLAIDSTSNREEIRSLAKSIRDLFTSDKLQYSDAINGLVDSNLAHLIPVLERVAKKELLLKQVLFHLAKRYDEPTDLLKALIQTAINKEDTVYVFVNKFYGDDAQRDEAVAEICSDKDSGLFQLCMLAKRAWPSNTTDAFDLRTLTEATWLKTKAGLDDIKDAQKAVMDFVQGRQTDQLPTDAKSFLAAYQKFIRRATIGISQEAASAPSE